MFILKYRVLNDSKFDIHYWEFKSRESLMYFVDNRIIHANVDKFEVLYIHELGDEYKLVPKVLSLEKVCVDKKKYSTNFAPCVCGKERENPKESLYCDSCYNVDYLKRLYTKMFD